jgi:hypothetical protein
MGLEYCAAASPDFVPIRQQLPESRPAVLANPLAVVDNA